MSSKRLADGLLAFGALVVLPLHVFLLTNQADPDLWGHLGVGRLMWETGDVPRSDALMLALRAPWVSHEWLFQLGVFLVFQVGGAAALLCLRAGFWIAIGGLLAACVALRGHGLAPRVVVLAPTLLTVGLGLDVRPQIVTYLGCALLAALLQGSRAAPPPWRERCRRWLTVSPWLLWPWSGAHGGFLAGAAALAIILVGESADARLGGTTALSAPQRRRLGAHLVLALAATVLNPYGLSLWTHLYAALTTADLPRYLTEWQPAWSAAGAHYRPFFGLYALALPAAFAACPRREREAASWLLALACLAASLRSIRHLPLLAIFAAGPLAAGLNAVLSRARAEPRAPPRLLLSAISAVMLCLIGGVIYADVIGRPRGLPWSALPAQLEGPQTGAQIIYPKAAVEFMQRHGLGGTVLNDFSVGGYVSWHLGPRAQTWVDSRCPEHCDRRVFSDYLRWTAGAEGWRRVPELHRTDLILASARSEVFARLSELRGWSPLYRDPDYVLLAPAGRHAALERACASGGCPSPRPPLPWLFP